MLHSVEVPAAHYVQVCADLSRASLWELPGGYDGDTENLTGLPHLYYHPDLIDHLTVMYDGPDPIGVVAVGDRMYHPNARDRWPVLHCFVAVPYRRQGIADRLLESVEVAWHRTGRPWDLLGFHGPHCEQLYRRHGIINIFDNDQV